MVSGEDIAADRCKLMDNGDMLTRPTTPRQYLTSMCVCLVWHYWEMCLVYDPLLHPSVPFCVGLEHSSLPLGLPRRCTPPPTMCTISMFYDTVPLSLKVCHIDNASRCLARPVSPNVVGSRPSHPLGDNHVRCLVVDVVNVVLVINGPRPQLL